MKKQKRDWLLIVCGLMIAAAYVAQATGASGLPDVVSVFDKSVFELINKMWWGVLLGIAAVGIMGVIPRELIMSVLGKSGTLSGIFRATLGGVLLDLCSHGILLVGAKLYERGASLGQVMAFLIASPWNSLALTFVLLSLVGIKWTVALLVLSLIIAVISGVIFDRLVKRGTLPANPNHKDLPEDFNFFQEFGTFWKGLHWTPQFVGGTLWTGLKESQMVLRWIFFGVVLASGIRAFVPIETFSAVFGPTLAGLGATLLFATILEVCSEGSMPVAADILLRARAPGNMFAFLMTGISTDYTEILVLKETTKSWKISFFLPLVTVPQVVLIALILNQFSV